ncbi:MAG: AAA family ATPase [bacterium]
MRLTQFDVCGYKNFTQPVVLTDLGPINILHGENNIGKSNLLEAMHLFFRVLSKDMSGDNIPLNQARMLDAATFFAHTGSRPSLIFNLWTRQPIEIQVSIAVDPASLEEARIKPLFDVSRVQVGVRLEWIDGDVEFRVTRFEFADGKDASSYRLRGERLQFIQRFALFLARNMLINDQADRPSFALIEETRRLKAASGAPPQEDAGILPQSLLKRLYQAKDSLDLDRVGNWRLFAELAESCFPQLQGGEFLARFDIDEGRAGLIWSKNGIRMPVELLGSGVQQALALLGHLLTTDATLVAIEEPECNLRYELQLRLRDAFRRVVDDTRGPRQLFMTSHSPAFEVGDCYYGMRMQGGVPVVERRPIETAALFLGMGVIRPPDDGRAPLSYVTPAGLVRLPSSVVERLGVQKGGTILFLDRDDETIEVLTADEVARRLDELEEKSR